MIFYFLTVFERFPLHMYKPCKAVLIFSSRRATSTNFLMNSLFVISDLGCPARVFLHSQFCNPHILFMLIFGCLTLRPTKLYSSNDSFLKFFLQFSQGNKDLFLHCSQPPWVLLKHLYRFPSFFFCQLYLVYAFTSVRSGTPYAHFYFIVKPFDPNATRLSAFLVVLVVLSLLSKRV